MYHSWKVRGKWCKYGDYVYRDDECECGCIRRVVIDFERGDTTIESYTLNENVTTSAPECPVKHSRSKKKKKIKNKGKMFSDFTEWKPPEQDYIMITVPKKEA